MVLPEGFIIEIKPLLHDQWNAFVDALNGEVPTSIRINRKKYKGGETPHAVPWCEDGFYLSQRPSFTFDPLFHAGAYYVQEASSMFVEQVFRQYVNNRTVRVLDLCAAPGGKSTHIASLISEDSLLVSNEVIRSRANILSENITKAGYPNVIVTNNDPSDIGKLQDFFDIILVDAPCSGEGMFRKDPQAVVEWSPANVQLCEERQRRIVADVWDALRPGGILIYSTCTYNTRENEQNIQWIADCLDAEFLSLEVCPAWNIHPAFDSEIPAYHFLPHCTKGEGFFLAALQKVGDCDVEEFCPVKKSKKQSKPKTLSLDVQYRNYLIDNERYMFFEKSGSWFAFPAVLFGYFEYIVSKLKLVSAGVYLGEVKGKDFIPQHSLAMSLALNVGAFEHVDVDKETAIAYLRKEALCFPNSAKGYLLLTYQNIPLGFVKNIGNRANNLYPNEWRIRSGYNPEE